MRLDVGMATVMGKRALQSVGMIIASSSAIMNFHLESEKYRGMVTGSCATGLFSRTSGKKGTSGIDNP